MAVSLPPGTRFELIRWSGKNCHLDRLEAADLLRLHVRKVRYQYPAVPHVCIGYSHGGTVLHWALADTAVELALMGYAYLSTPFLDVEHRQDAEKTAAYVGSLCSLILVLGLTGLLTYHWNLGFSGFIEVEWLVTILCLPLGFYLNKKFNRLRSAAEKFANTFPQPKCYVEKGIVIRTPGDEASIALSTISAIHMIRVQAAIRNENWSTALAKRASRLEVGFRRFFIEVVVPVSLWALSLDFSSSGLGLVWTWQGTLCSLGLMLRVLRPGHGL